MSEELTLGRTPAAEQRLAEVDVEELAEHALAVGMLRDVFPDSSHIATWNREEPPPSSYLRIAPCERREQ